MFDSVEGWANTQDLGSGGTERIHLIQLTTYPLWSLPPVFGRPFPSPLNTGCTSMESLSYQRHSHVSQRGTKAMGNGGFALWALIVHPGWPAVCAWNREISAPTGLHWRAPMHGLSWNRSTQMRWSLSSRQLLAVTSPVCILGMVRSWPEWQAQRGSWVANR